MNLTDAFCKGMKPRFGGFPCEHYDPSAEECHLIRKGEAREIFEKGRCDPSKMLMSAISKYFKVYENLVFGEHKAHKKDKNEYANFILDRISDRSMNLKKGYTLPILIGYIRKAARNEILRIFGKESLIRKICGRCVFLSLPKPHICQRPEILLTQEGKESHEPNPNYNKKRSASDKACKDGFKLFEPDISPDEASVADETETVFRKLEVRDIKKKLSGRYANNRIARRQYAVFTKFYQLLSDGLDPSTAITHIAKQLGVSERTVRNDLSAIKKIWEKNIS